MNVIRVLRNIYLETNLDNVFDYQTLPMMLENVVYVQFLALDDIAENVDWYVFVIDAKYH